MKTIPDDGVQTGQQAAPGLDTFEMAARMGSVASFRRSGNVVLVDPFSAVSKWDIVPGYETGGKLQLDALNAYSGDMSGQLSLSTGGGGVCYIRRFLPVTVGRRVGAEFTFALNSILALDTTAILTVGSGIDTANQYYGAIEFVMTRTIPVKNRLYYYDKAISGYVLLDQFGQASNGPVYWNNCKIAVDLGTLKYISLDFNGRHYDLTGKDLPTTTENFYQYANARVGLLGSVGDTINIDNFIYTVDEP